MIKKLTSMALVGIMSFSMLTGCGVNDLGYLKYSRELSDITEYSFENSTTINVSEEAAGEEYNVDFTLNGEANLEDLKSMYMSFDLLFDINDMGIENPMNFKIADNKVYVSKNSLLEIVNFAKIMKSDSEAKIMQEVYDNDLKDADYILLTDLGDVYKDMSYKEMSDSAYDYLTKAFKGFDSKLITKTSKGYSVELSSENALTFVKSLVDYLSENKALVFDESVNYLVDIYSNMEVEGLTEEAKQEMFTEIKESRQDFYDFVDEAALVLDSGELDSYLDMVDGSKIKSEVYKQGKSHKEKIEGKAVFKGVEMGNFVSETTITPKNIEKTSIEGNIVAVEELEKLLDSAENRINPVQTLELEWYPGDTSAMVTSTRIEGNTDFNIQPYTIVDGRIYLPLRYIGEAFGEEVSWDDAAKTAYIVRGAEKIDMTGIIVDSKTMVKVRDFEKLGYKVGFVQNENSSVATISK
nr:copper amine oxidase N-terminal domain-containing protein [Sedimentibacter sp.]